MITYRCDQCGDEEERAKLIALVVSTPRAIQKQEDESPFATLFSSAASDRDEEQFHLCPACGVQMHLALKQRQKEIREAVSVETLARKAVRM